MYSKNSYGHLSLLHVIRCVRYKNLKFKNISRLTILQKRKPKETRKEINPVNDEIVKQSYNCLL